MLIRPNSCLTCAAMHRENPQLMQCRLNPPTVTPILEFTPQGPRVAGNVTMFPQVNAGMVCRQYVRGVALADDLSSAVVQGAA